MSGNSMMAKGGCAVTYKINGNVVRENILLHKISVSSTLRDNAGFWKSNGGSIYQIWENSYPDSPIYTKDYAFQFIVTFMSSDPILFVSHYPWGYDDTVAPNTIRITSNKGFTYLLTAGIWVENSEFTSINNTYDIVSGTIVLANNGIGLGIE
jgi:hypothetical protein